MAENKGGHVIQYNWELEEEHNRINRLTTTAAESTTIPRIGSKWRYYPVGSSSKHDDAYDTKGKVTSIDKESGVICTDAGEILIRG